MPWSVKKKGSEHCVMDKMGKTIKCHPNRKAAEEHMAAMYANTTEKLEQVSASMLEDGGPVVTGVGITNIPHLPLPPMSIVNIDGQEYVRVPFLRKGIFEYKDTNLVFDDPIFEKMIDNHTKGISHWGVMLNERHRQDDALAWFDKKGGGWFAKEADPEFGDLLVGYGKPTGNEILDLVKNQKYRYASVEFKPKYKSPMVAKLSSEDLTEIQLEDLLGLEDVMENVTISLEEYTTLKETADKASKVTQLEADLEASKAKIVELEAKVKPDKVELELPESIRLEMEQNRNEIARLKQDGLVREVELIISKATGYRDANGYGHSPVLLEAARAAMLGAEVKKGEDTIKLESSNPASVADYFRKIFVYLLGNMPGQVKMEGKSENEDERSVSLESDQTYSQSDFKSWWAESM